MSDAAPKKKLIRWSFKRANSTPAPELAGRSTIEETMSPALQERPTAPASPTWGSTCPICFKTVKSMKILNCKHEFCLDCLQQLLQNETHNQNGVSTGACCAPCPICRESCRLEDLDQLPSKVYGYLPCGFCAKDKPVEDLWWCSQCVKILCSRCAFKYHRKLDGHPEPEPWDSLRALEQACYVLGLESSQKSQAESEEAVAQRLDAKISEMENLRQALVSFFGDVTDVIMNQVAEEEFADAAQTKTDTDMKSTVISLIQEHFGLERKVCRIPRDQSTSDLQQTLLSVSKMALTMVGVKIPDSRTQPVHEKTMTNAVKSVLLTSCPKDVAKTLTTHPQTANITPPVLPKRRIRSVHSISLGGCMLRGTTYNSPTTSSESDPSSSDDSASSPPIIREKRRLTLTDPRETILGETFEPSSFKFLAQDHYCLAHDSIKAVLWRRGTNSCSFETVLSLSPHFQEGEQFLSVVPVDVEHFWSLEGTRTASRLILRGSSRRSIAVDRNGHNILAVSLEPEDTIVTGRKGCSELSVSEIRNNQIIPSQHLDMSDYQKEFSLVSLALSKDGAKLAALNGTCGYFLFSKCSDSAKNGHFQLIRRLSFQNLGMEGVVSPLSHFHQFQFISCKDNSLLVIKTQSGVAAFSINYLCNPTYAFESSTGTDEALVARRQKEVMRIQEFLGHPWGFQALQKTTQVISVTGLEVPCKFLGHWQGNLLCPSPDKIKVAGVQLRPTA